jgi:hypothetical protein
MKKHFQFILTSAISFAVIYLLASFICADFDCANWGELVRFNLVLTWLFPTIMSAMYTYNFFDKLN